MIGGQHTKERFSERLQGCQNQPKNRGYLPGTKLVTCGYNTRTLEGNWFEERADAGYYNGVAVLSTSHANVWTTDYRAMTDKAGNTLKCPNFDQQTLMDIVDHNDRAYPAHQPHLDVQQETIARDRFKTTMRETYKRPQEATLQGESHPQLFCGGTSTAQAKAVIGRYQHQLLQSRCGESAFPGNVLRSVRIEFERNDMSKNQMLTVEEAQRALEAFVCTSRPECAALVRAFDVKGDGTVPIDKLMEELRGELRDRRYGIVDKVYAMLMKMCPEGIVRLKHLADLVDIDSMPLVMSGSITSSAAHKAFVEQWDLPLESYISFETFLLYFMDVSFEIKSDQEFEVFMRNIWHLSGGNGKSMNTSCRRLRVVHKNGRITTQEVKNDLDIKDGDPNLMERIIANLALQGVKDVATFEILPRP